MDLERHVRELLDYREILELRYRYGYYLDDRDWERWLDLFTEDVECDYGWYGQYDGKDELREGLVEGEDHFEYSAHVYVQPVVDVDGDTATGEWYSVIYNAYADEDVGGWRQARYTDSYRRVDGEWRISAVSHTFYARKMFATERRDTEREGDVIEYLASVDPE